MMDVSVLRDKYRQEKQALWAHIANSSASGRGLKRSLGRLARLADVLLSHLWRDAGFEHGEALIAVGGYGRGELFPSSDVDVLVLLPDGANTDDSSDLKSKIEAFIGSCWDSGLEIGSSVRTLQDCLLESEKDITIQTSLLESRYITGSQKLYRQFTSSYDKAMDPQAFFVAKTLEMQQRHNKFENSPYSLEPNCKESPGGLRDLQMLLWLAKASGFDVMQALARARKLRRRGPPPSSTRCGQSARRWSHLPQSQHGSKRSPGCRTAPACAPSIPPSR